MAESVGRARRGDRSRGAAFGAFVALFISHRRGIYFALMTIAFGQVFFFIAIKWTSVTERRGRAAQHPAPARSISAS